MVGSDDSVRLDSFGDRICVWSNPWFVHLRPDAARWFPELNAIEPTLQLSGELKIQVDLEHVWTGCCAPHSEVYSSLIMERSSGSSSRIEPADPREIAEALIPSVVRIRSDLEAIKRAAQIAAGCRPARLIVGDDLDETVATIRKWLEADDDR